MQLNFLRRASAPAFPQPPAPVPDPENLEEKARLLLHSIGCKALAQKVQVRWNPRMRSTAGMAYPARALVTLNPRLRTFGPEEIDRTLRHELAHLVAHARVGRRRIAAHGPEWRQACIDLGLPNERRCHDLPLPKRHVPRSHFYQCPACGTELARVRPLKRKSACLACCRKHSNGQYDERFRFAKISKRAQAGDASAPDTSTV